MASCYYTIIWKGADGTLYIPFDGEEFDDIDLKLSTTGDSIVEVSDFEVHDNFIVVPIESGQLDLLPDGVIRYALTIDGVTDAGNLNAVLKTPDGYDGETADDIYQRGYEAGQESCQDDLKANLQADYFVIPEGTTKLRNYAFTSCNLGELEIPDSVKTIGQSAFEGTEIGTITIPDSVINCAYAAFRRCRMTDVSIGSGLIRLPSNCFYDCPNLTGVSFSENSRLTELGEATFMFTKINSISLPSGLTKIDKGCFESTALTGITVPEGVETLGGRAFGSCSALTSAVLPSTLTTISGYCFADCVSLSSITIPENVTVVGVWAFQGCSGLTEMTFTGLVPPTLMLNALGSTDYTFPIYVPCESVEAYRTAFGNYAERVTCRGE